MRKPLTAFHFNERRSDMQNFAWFYLCRGNSYEPIIVTGRWLVRWFASSVGRKLHLISKRPCFHRCLCKLA